MRWAGHVAYRDLVREPEGNVSLGRPRHRYVYNIKMDLKEGQWEAMGWINMV